MRNSDLFIVAFNRIDKFLRHLTSYDHYVSFSKLVDTVSKSNAVVRQYKDYLKEFADLRNAITHNRIEPDYVIAEPHDSIVTLIQEIEHELMVPKWVYPLFKKDVVRFQLDNRLTEVLFAIREYRYTQFPIYKGNEFKGLITESGITRWIVSNVEDDIVSFSETKLDDIICFEKKENNYKFISSNTSIYEAEDLFFKNINNTSIRLDALLITKTGKSNEPLLGMITPWDVINLLKNNQLMLWMV